MSSMFGMNQSRESKMVCQISFPYLLNSWPWDIMSKDLQMRQSVGMRAPLYKRPLVSPWASTANHRRYIQDVVVGSTQPAALLHWCWGRSHVDPACVCLEWGRGSVTALPPGAPSAPSQAVPTPFHHRGRLGIPDSPALFATAPAHQSTFYGFGFYRVCDLEFLKCFQERSDRSEFALGKLSLTACWKVDWKELIELSLSSSQVQKCLQWPCN